MLYLIFNEGYHERRPAPAPGGPLGEAIRLGRLLRALLPADREVAGLLALMLLTDARRAANRVDGELIRSTSRTVRSGIEV